MLTKPYCVKKYKSAEKRFLKSTIKQFFLNEFPKYFGPKVADGIALEMINIFNQLNIDTKTLKPGQMLWNALDKTTRADSPNVKFVPVILTLANEQDIQSYVKGEKISSIAENSLARITREAFEQGGLLSMRDIALITFRSNSSISTIRMNYEKKHNVILPHPGALHDMGSCVTHKKQIIYKVIVEKKDPRLVATETNHSQKAVDNYLYNYHRVITLYKNNNDIDYIHFITKIAKHVIKQYICIYDTHVKPIS